MNKLYSIGLLTSLLIGFTSLSAQDYAFKVLANKGDNKVQKENGEVLDLNSRDLVYATDLIITSESAYIGLMHNSGKAQEIKGAQRVSVSDLIINVGGQAVTSLNKYAQMLSTRLVEGEAEKKVKVGTRSVGSKINVMIPSEESDLFGTKAVIKWSSADLDTAAVYEVVILDILDEVVYQTETKLDSVLIDFNEVQSDMGLYVLQVRKKDDPSFASPSFPIKHLTGADAANISEDFEPLSTALSQDSPLNLLIIASFFDDNELFLDAQYHYEKAISLSPDIPEYQELYDIFLESYGLSN